MPKEPFNSNPPPSETVRNTKFVIWGKCEVNRGHWPRWPRWPNRQCANSSLAMSWPNHVQILSFASMAPSQVARKHDFVAKVAGGCSSYDVIAPWPDLTRSNFFAKNCARFAPSGSPKPGGATRRRFFAIREKPQGGGGGAPPLYGRGLIDFFPDCSLIVRVYTADLTLCNYHNISIIIGVTFLHIPNVMKRHKVSRVLKNGDLFFDNCQHWYIIFSEQGNWGCFDWYWGHSSTDRPAKGVSDCPSVLQIHFIIHIFTNYRFWHCFRSPFSHSRSPDCPKNPYLKDK